MRRLSRMSRPVKILVWGRQAGRLLGTSRGPARRRGDRFSVENGLVDGAGRHAEGLGDAVDVGQPPAGWQGDDDGAHVAQCRVDVRGIDTRRSATTRHGRRGRARGLSPSPRAAHCPGGAAPHRPGPAADELLSRDRARARSWHAAGPALASTKQWNGSRTPCRPSLLQTVRGQRARPAVTRPATAADNTPSRRLCDRCQRSRRQVQSAGASCRLVSGFQVLSRPFTGRMPSAQAVKAAG